MVFGYYHITMRRVQSSEFPELNFPPDTEIEQKVKVGHLMWIPFIPLDKVWAVSIGNNMYQLSGDAEHKIEQTLGKRGYPWYSFFGLIAVPALIILFSIFSAYNQKMSKKRSIAYFENKRDKLNEHVDQPQPEDMFFFKDSEYHQIALKVESSDTDSIYFKSPVDNENKKWGTINWAFGYYNSDNPTQTSAFAKLDLKKSFQQDYSESMYKKGISHGNLPVEGLIQLEKVEQTLDERKPIPIVSAKEQNSVKEAFNHFVEHVDNLDSLVNLMDNASYKFFQDQLIEANKADNIIVKGLKSNRNQNSLYELLMYTRYVYLKAGEGQEGDPNRLTEAMADLKDYIFFLKLLEKGYLSLNNQHIKEAEVVNINIPDENTASLTIKSMSNFLKQPKKVSYLVEMSKQDGKWKINLPSTYSYTESQLLSMQYNDNVQNVSGQWREMVRANIKEIEAETVISPFWDY